MRRIFNSKLFVSGVSLAVGVGLGAGCFRDLVNRSGFAHVKNDPLRDFYKQLPALLIPGVCAATVDFATRSEPHGGQTVEIMKYGFPALSQIKSRESYVIAYDPRNRTALWVVEQLTDKAITGNSNRKFSEFKEDDSVHPYHRATNDDYRGSGLDRGHLAAAANHKWSQKAMNDTFYLSNIAPQNPHLNQNAWNNLEQYCRSLTKYNKNVYVCTGPLYLPRMEADGKMYVKYQVIGANNVAVPTHFFKVVILEKFNGEIELRSYIMPNQPVATTIPLERFLVPIESIERASGLLFVPNILKRTNSLKAITSGNC